MFVTGSSGFLGIHLVDNARARGYQVTGLDTRMPPINEPSPHHFICRDVASINPGMLTGMDVVVHFAAYTSLVAFADDMAGNYTTNVSAFLNLLDCARKAGVRKVVYASSSAVYCDGMGTSFREDVPIDHTRLVSHYGKSKLMDELAACSFEDALGMNVLGLRYFNVYGPGDERKLDRCAPVQHFLHSRASGKPIVIYGDGHQAKDFIYVRDAIHATFRLIDADARGVYNIGTGVATTFNRVAQLIGGPVEYCPHPSPFGYMLYTRADTTKLLATIGPYEFLPIESGLSRMMGAQRAA